MVELEFVKGGVYCFTSYAGVFYPTLYVGGKFIFFSDKSESLESVVRDDLASEKVSVTFVGMLEEFSQHV